VPLRNSASAAFTDLFDAKRASLDELKRPNSIRGRGPAGMPHSIRGARPREGSCASTPRSVSDGKARVLVLDMFGESKLPRTRLPARLVF
jgi:hypothetical protein